MLMNRLQAPIDLTDNIPDRSHRFTGNPFDDALATLKLAGQVESLELLRVAFLYIHNLCLQHLEGHIVVMQGGTARSFGARGGMRQG